jgi:hypothetical protein
MQPDGYITQNIADKNDAYCRCIGKWLGIRYFRESGSSRKKIILFFSIAIL